MTDLQRINYIYNTLEEKVYDNRESFVKECMNKTAKELYDKSYEINFKESYYNLLSSGALRDHEDFDVIAEWLIKQENILNYIYELWLGCGLMYSEDWEDMIEWLKNEYKYEIEDDE